LAGGALVLMVSLFDPVRRHLRPGVALLAFVVAFYLYGATVLLPAINPYKSPRGMSEAIRARVSSEAPLRGFHAWKWRASYSYYARRPIPPLVGAEALRAYWRSPGEVFVVVERGLLEEARAVLGPIEPLCWRETGSNAAYLFSNRQEPEVK
jgi:hypothetical protein